MVNVNVRFNSRDYLLACEDGQEKELEKLTTELNNKFGKLKADLGNLGEGKLLLITAIQLVDEMSAMKGSMQKFKEHNKELEVKFKEDKGNYTNIMLLGAATFVFEGKIALP